MALAVLSAGLSVLDIPTTTTKESPNKTPKVNLGNHSDGFMYQTCVWLCMCVCMSSCVCSYVEHISKYAVVMLLQHKLLVVTILTPRCCMADVLADVASIMLLLLVRLLLMMTMILFASR